jgi:predicted TPR repeat methyltransferase
MADEASPGEGLAAQFAAAPDEVVAMYDDWAAAQYDADLAAWGYDAPARAAEMIEALVSTGPVFDAGCGSGLVGDELMRRGVEPIVGGDFSTVSVETARSRGVYRDVVVLDLNAPIDFADGRFTAVVSVGVFSYLTDSAATIRELLRIVEPGGPVVFTQRTDLWEDRDFDGLLSGLADEGVCDVSVSSPQPYLPRHPEFGGAIGIRYATLTRC